MIIRHDADYRELRRQAYPNMGEQLDAVFKLAQYLQGKGHDLPAEVQQWIANCKEVKERFPAR